MDNQNLDGLSIAKMLKFYMTKKSDSFAYKKTYSKKGVLSFYSKHEDMFNKAAELFRKHNVDAQAYAKWLVFKNGINESNIDNFMSKLMLSRYAEHLEIKQKRAKIYKQFIQTVDNIVEDCLNNGFNTVADYFIWLIDSKKLSAYYVSGKLSDYYLASIPTFKKIINKLDDFQKVDFKELYDRFESYNIAATEAILQEKNIKINPIKFTNDKIFDAKNV